MGAFPPTPSPPLGLRLVCVSDTHGRHRNVNVPPGDILIHAGDFTHFGKEKDVVDFNEWLGEQDFKHRIVINGGCVGAWMGGWGGRRGCRGCGSAGWVGRALRGAADAATILRGLRLHSLLQPPPVHILAIGPPSPLTHSTSPTTPPLAAARLRPWSPLPHS